jgi:putative thiamine transport system ATP-binding protein
MTTQLILDAVTISIGERVLIPGLDLQVAPGEIVTVMGPSGCGKSALLSFVGGTIDPAFDARGRIFVGDVDITHLPPDRRRIGVLFQDDLLFPHLSVGGNLAFGLPAEITGRRARMQRIEAALDDAGLAGFQDRDPSTLSGGQRARVTLMRTLLSEPCALLLDEPFGKLDAALREDFRRFVFSHAAARRLPVLMVTHDIADALATGGRILTIDTDPVVIRSEGSQAFSGTAAPTGNVRSPIPSRSPQIHMS